jgi:hypothetical protein
MVYEDEREGLVRSIGLEPGGGGRRVRFARSSPHPPNLTVVHRLFASGSDRAAERWRQAYRLPGTQTLELHHLTPSPPACRAVALATRCARAHARREAEGLIRFDLV